MSKPILTPCHCPGAPHENDEFYLADELPMSAGLAAAVAGEGLHNIVPALLRHGALAGWNLVDEDGKPVPVNPETVDERLTWTTAQEFLSEALPILVLAARPTPLGSTPSPMRNGRSSRTGRTARSTSAKTPSSDTPPAPSE